MPDIFIDEEGLEKNPLETKTEQPPAPTPIEEDKKTSDTVPPHHLNTKSSKPTKKIAFSHFFSGYDSTPSSVRFGDQMENEIPLLFLRKHFITNLPWIILALALSLIPVIIELSISLGIFNLSIFSEDGKFLIYIFYYFFIISGYVFVHYLTWFYNISLVTNVRVVDIDFSNIVFEDVAATKLSQLEDVSYSQIGILRSIFDYGDVRLQTAGTASNFEFLAVPHPEKVIKTINNLIGKNKHA